MVGEFKLKRLIAGELGLLTSQPVSDTSGISDSANLVTVQDVSKFAAPPFYAFIEDEVVKANAIHSSSTTAFDIGRGEKGSYPTSHPKGVTFSTADTLFLELLDDWWSMHGDKDFIFYPLRYLYAKKQALIWLLGGNWKNVNWQQARTIQSDSDRFKHLQELLTYTQGQIDVIETMVKTQGTVLVGAIKAVTPVEPVWWSQVFGPDPNDPAYRGDPTHRYPGDGLWPTS